MPLDKRSFRFVFRLGEFKWVHRAEMRQLDVDCSNMSDKEFEAFVRRVKLAPRENRDRNDR